MLVVFLLQTLLGIEDEWQQVTELGKHRQSQNVRVPMLFCHLIPGCQEDYGHGESEKNAGVYYLNDVQLSCIFVELVFGPFVVFYLVKLTAR